MAAQSVAAATSQLSATGKVAEPTAASVVDAAAFLSPHHQSSRKPHGQSLIRCMMERMKQLLTRGSSPALYLANRTKELPRRCFGNQVSSAASEVGNDLMGIEAYFSIPVVVPVTSRGV